MTDTTKFRVETVSVVGDKVVNVWTFDYLRQAERFENGFNINLNHEKYWTRIVEPTAIRQGGAHD